MHYAKEVTKVLNKQYLTPEEFPVLKTEKRRLLTICIIHFVLSEMSFYFDK